MKGGAPGSFGAQLRALREAAGFTQEELATIGGLSVHAVSALERGGTTAAPCRDRALSAALDLTGATRDGLPGSPRARSPRLLGWRTSPHPNCRGAHVRQGA
jgi:transcriptional regulator with XRE-family HTH domain